MTAVWKTDIGPATRRLVLLALADICNDDGVGWPSIDTLAMRANCTRTTAEDSLRSLVADKIITREARGFHRSNLYQIDPSKLTPAIRGSRKTPGKPADDPRIPGRETPGFPGTEPSVEPSIEPSSSEVADATTDQQPRPDVDQLCGQLRDAMITNGCKPPTITQTWRKTARLLLDRDKRPLAEAVAVLAWCQADEFWKANIQSLPTFRAQYDKLRLRWEQTRPVEHPSSPETIKEWVRQQWKLGHVAEIEERTKLRYTPPPLPDHIKTVDQARDFHANAIRAWITEHNDEITRLLTTTNDQQEAS